MVDQSPESPARPAGATAEPAEGFEESQDTPINVGGTEFSTTTTAPEAEAPTSDSPAEHDHSPEALRQADIEAAVAEIRDLKAGDTPFVVQGDLYIPEEVKSQTTPDNQNPQLIDDSGESIITGAFFVKVGGDAWVAWTGDQPHFVPLTSENERAIQIDTADGLKPLSEVDDLNERDSDLVKQVTIKKVDENGTPYIDVPGPEGTADEGIVGVEIDPN
ncbi:MAG TPA: hypothetical protein VK963_03555 [Candidatus Saccharimonadales bacterium]|nr:hypothetical protein [Candidatus Saccharimonadales bacterium]